MTQMPSNSGSTPAPLAVKYQQAFAILAQANGDATAALRLLLECVQGDPSNLIFLDTFLQTLRQQNVHRSAAQRWPWQGIWDRLRFEIARHRQNWEQVIRRGLRLLTMRPTDGLILCGLGDAMMRLGHRDAALRYWTVASEAHPDNQSIQRRCAHAFPRLGLYDRADQCWQRVVELESVSKPRMRLRWSIPVPNLMPSVSTSCDRIAVSDDVAARQRNCLGQTPLVSPSDRYAAGATSPQPSPCPTRAIVPAAEPLDNPSALERAQRLVEDGEIAAAVELLTRARRASPGDLRIVEKLEDLDLLSAQHGLQRARQQVHAEMDEMDRQLLADLEADLVRREIHYFSARAARYPEEHSWKIKLAHSLKRAGNFNQACVVLEELPTQQAQGTLVQLEWGECLQYQRRFEEALVHYHAAAASAMAAAHLDAVGQLALYRAGVLASQLGDLAKAFQYLQTLTKSDPNYKDSKEHLDKIASIRHKDGFSPE